MAPELEDFDRTGPKQLAVVDWRNNHDCRAVAARLVRKHTSQNAIARNPKIPMFGFPLAVLFTFEHTDPNNLPECAPKCVIAFRGTILKPSSAEQDMKLNIKLLTAELRKDNSRFKPALDAVKEVVQEAEPANIWLAGHSLGSAIAMLVGKSMAEEQGKYLKTFLFNPPFLRLPSQGISTVHVWRM
ncbi:GDSL esterase/lipase [Vitis vinifera]|uniref:GDSL esterase/lipase n=1 Tax=Vitis vinifera TaxID=29760 RepID=A0A438E0M4_VITVI|nr:GDSL esterase/lipase [Vitis vinifera]